MAQPISLVRGTSLSEHHREAGPNGTKIKLSPQAPSSSTTQPLLVLKVLILTYQGEEEGSSSLNTQWAQDSVTLFLPTPWSSPAPWPLSTCKDCLLTSIQV